MTKYFRGTLKPDATIKVVYRVNGYMGTIIFHTSIITILLVVMHSSKNKMQKFDGFAVILMEFSSARWHTISNLITLCMVEVWYVVTSHVWACKVLLSLLLWVTGRKKWKYFHNFVLIMGSLESNIAVVLYHKWLKPIKTYRLML